MISDGVHAHTCTGADGEPTLVVTGDVDLATAQLFQDALDAAAAGRTQLTVDLTDLGFLDSAGIKVLFDLAARLDLHLIVDPHGVIASTITICGLGRAATIRTSR